MSLRAFHLAFIAAAVILAAFVTAWAVGQYRLEHEAEYVVLGALAVVLAAALVFYGAAFQRKTKNL
jgi:hypothetical protein